MSAGGCNIRRDIETVFQIEILTQVIDKGRRKVAIHLTASGERIIVGVAIKLSEELVEIHQAKSQHECLVTIVTGTEITLLPGPGHSHLCHLFAVANDTKIGAAVEHLLARYDTRFPAQTANSEVIQHLLAIFG